VQVETDLKLCVGVWIHANSCSLIQLPVQSDIDDSEVKVKLSLYLTN
jgi:hypothetical protein